MSFHQLTQGFATVLILSSQTMGQWSLLLSHSLPQVRIFGCDPSPLRATPIYSSPSMCPPRWGQSSIIMPGALYHIITLMCWRYDVIVVKYCILYHIIYTLWVFGIMIFSLKYYNNPLTPLIGLHGQLPNAGCVCMTSRVVSWASLSLHTKKMSGYFLFQVFQVLIPKRHYFSCYRLCTVWATDSWSICMPETAHHHLLLRTVWSQIWVLHGPSQSILLWGRNWLCLGWCHWCRTGRTAKMYRSESQLLC